MAAATRWIRPLSTGPVGYPDSAMAVVTKDPRLSYLAMAAWTAAESVSASSGPARMARTNAAAVLGYLCAHAVVAT